MLDLKREYKVTYYYLTVAIALLFFLKFIVSSAFAYIIDYFITFLPFAIILIASLWSFYQYEKHPEKKLSIEKHTLFNVFYLLLITLGFYILYSPTSFAIILQSFKNLLRILDPENFFILISYLAVGVVAFTLIFYFFRLYQKSIGNYQGSMTRLGKECLYSVFFVLLFILGSSILAFPDSYKPIIDFGSDLIFTLTAGNVQVSKFDGTANQRINSLKKVSDSLSDSLSATYKNLSQNFSDSNRKLADTLVENKNILDNTITKTNKDLKNNLSDDFQKKLDSQDENLKSYVNSKVEDISMSSGSNLELSGNLIVKGSTRFQGLDSGLVKANSSGTLENASAGTDYENPLTFSNPLVRSGNTISLDYQSSNLKITSGKLNTIQDIGTSSSPTFNNGIYSGNLSVKGTGNSYFKGKLSIGTTANNGLFQVNSVDTALSAPNSVNEASATYADAPITNQQVDPEASASAEVVWDDGGGFYNFGIYHAIRVYPYKEIDGVRYYSHDYFEASYSDNAEETGSYYLNWNWPEVAGADGYRVLKYDSSNGYQWDVHTDVIANSLNGDGYSFTWENDHSETTPNYVSGMGDYFDNGATQAIKVYAYRTVSGTRYYSEAAQSESFVDSGSNSKNYYITWSWEAVDGAEGYRILKYDNHSDFGYNYDHYYDTTSTSFVDGNGSMSWSGGSTVTPTSGTVGTAFLVGSNGNVGINTDNPLALLDVNGVGVHGLGTASNPSFAFRSDLNTGMWSSGADTINFSTNGTERMRVSSTGYLGVGTINPQSPLSVAIDEVNGGVSDVLSLYHSQTVSVSSGFAGAESLKTGLVGYWKMDESSGTTVADSKGSYGGTSSSSSNISNGKIGMSRTFAGGGGTYVSLGTSTNLAPAKFTFSAWIYPTEATQGTIFSRYSSDYVFLYFNSDRKVGMLISTNGSGSWAGGDGIAQLSLNNWHHIALNYDGSAIKIYVDGSLDNTIYYGGNLNSGRAGTSEIGRRAAYGDLGFIGRIDEAGLWSRALSASEVSSLYNSGSGSTYISGGTDLGTAMLFQAKNSGSSIFGSARINSSIFSNTSGNETSSLIFETISAGTMAERMRLDMDGNLKIASLTSNGSVYSNGGVLTNTNPSDERLKKNIENLDSVLPGIMQLRPVSFEWKSNGETARGFIAQEVEKIFPELVGEGLNGYKGLYTDQFIPYLTKAIQEQQQEIEIHKDSIAGIELKTAENVITVSDLKLSIDGQLEKISDTLKSDEENAKEQKDSLDDLKDQIEELKSRTNADLNLAQLESDAQDINYLKTLLGITDGGTAGDISLIGNLKAEKVIVSGVETIELKIKSNDDDALTIGEDEIKTVEKDENKDGVDDETGLDGTKVYIKTKAVKDTSRIFVTASGAPEVKGDYKVKDSDGNTQTVTMEMNEPLYIGKVEAGKGFEVKIAHPVTEDVQFHWWIVEDGNDN